MKGTTKPAPTSRRSVRYERQRARIVDAAVPLLNDKGVGGMTLQEVAHALDLATTSVTYYYRYKEHLAAAVFEDTMQRLAAMVDEAAREDTPRGRVRCYVGLFLDQLALSLRGKDRPLAVLSELRTLEDPVRLPLLQQYQAIFRSLRNLFGDAGSVETKRLYSARAQFLNETLFWSALSLRRYPMGDTSNVRRRMLDVLENGVGVSGTAWQLRQIEASAGDPDEPKQEFLRVASKLINDIGYKGASVDRIARELKLTKGSFYHHLEAKDDLILDCFHHDYRRLTQLVRRIGPDGSVADRLASGYAAALNLQFDGFHPLLRSTALQAMPKTVRQVAAERFERSAFWLSGMLTDGMAEGSIRIVDPMIAANIMIATANSAYDMRSWASKQSREEALDIYLRMLMRGLFA